MTLYHGYRMGRRSTGRKNTKREVGALANPRLQKGLASSLRGGKLVKDVWGKTFKGKGEISGGKPALRHPTISPNKVFVLLGIRKKLREKP